MTSHRLETHPIHLGLGAKAVPQPDFAGGMEWYDAYSRRTEADGAEGRLVAVHRFAESWTSWEMHPSGDEVVLCLSGTMTLHQEHPDGRHETVTLDPGQYAVNPPAVWHTADLDAPVEALFITAGLGTIHRPR